MLRKDAIAFYMHRRGIQTQKELAEMVNIPRTHLNQIINGKSGGITLDTLDKLCTGLDVPPQDLIEWHRKGTALATAE